MEVLAYEETGARRSNGHANACALATLGSDET